MSLWDKLKDEDYIEYVKWNAAEPDDAVLYENVKVLYGWIYPQTIQEYTNQWGNIQYRLQIIKFWKQQNRISERPEFLSAGKRLLFEIRKYKDREEVCVKILRIGEKFDTMYRITEYKGFHEKTGTPIKLTKK
jgi:hypothetical protein